METINFLGKIDPWEVYRKLEKEYFDEVEKTIRRRLSPTTLNNPSKLDAVEGLINAIIKESVDLLHEICLGGHIYWDDRLERQPTYKSCPYVVVDPVDGAKELKRGGTEISSTIAIKTETGMPLAVVSYPFGRERIVDINGKIYRLPHGFDFEHQSKELDKEYRLRPRKSKKHASQLHIAENYEVDDDIRKKLDELRALTRESFPMRRLGGSSAKIMVAVATGPLDVYIRTMRPRFCDYLVPRKIIRDLGGVFTDLDGNEPDDKNDMNGIIAASTRENYDLFVGFLNNQRRH